MMKLYVAGGCSEHGRNSFLLTAEGLALLVDAGRMKEKPDKPFPEIGAEEARRIRYLFLTHSHTDHTGAIGFLKKLGFHGTIVASLATLNILPSAGEFDRIAINEHSAPGEVFELTDRIRVTWGRAGHCIGSVWYSIEVDGRTVLFTGDYEENSLAYTCDFIRDLKADLAVVDCAYGTEKEDSADHWKLLTDTLDGLIHRGKPLLFPVPSHGRGFDVTRLLAERGVTVVLADSLIQEYTDSVNRGFWLKKDFTDALKKLRKRSVQGFREDFKRAIAAGEMFPGEYMDTAILVRDSQLVKEDNRRIAEGVYATGGLTILTGKQDPSSYARKLLDEGKAAFCRISVHQNISEMRSLLQKNHFHKVVPYHCREQLHFDEPGILVMQPGESVGIE